MAVTDSNQFFINMKTIPDSDSQEYDDFFEEERRKIEYGVTINGVYIHGWLYFHLNYWQIFKDFKDPINHVIRRKFDKPDCRDNEWIIAEHLKAAEEQRKGLLIFGSRRLGKSEFEASYVGRHATIYEGSENVVSGGSWENIDIITSKIDKGLAAMHPYFLFDRVANDPRKEIALGVKTKKNQKIEWAKILPRNFDNGLKTEAVAGITASSFLLDECGQFDWLKCFDAAKPAFTSPYGWRVVPIVTGTSGLLKSNTDAEKVFNNPEAYNFLSIFLEDEKKVTAVFIPGTRRMEAKYKTSIGGFIETEKGILIPENSELHNIPFWNSDLKKGSEIIDAEVEQAKLSPDPAAVLKAKMYYPKNTSDLFLSVEDNQFPIEAIKEVISYLEHNKEDSRIVGKPIRVFRGVDGKVDYEEDFDRKIICEWPVKADTIKDAPIWMFESPMKDAPAYLFCAGADPYNQSESKNSPSLGTLYVYKRMYDPVAGTFQKSIVASLASRPKTMNKWHENVELLLELYNATVMPESEGNTFIQYFDLKNKGHLVADGYSFLKEITPNTSITGRMKGLPATKGVISFCMNLLYEYCNEEIVVGLHPETNEPIKKLGVWRIRDKMLLIEMLNWKPGENVDRIVGFRHALAYDRYLDKIAPLINIPSQEKIERPKPIRSPFTTGKSNPFGVKARNPFK